METIPGNNTSPFAEPQRQSPAAIFILTLKSAVAIFKTFWPALLVILFRTGKEDESPRVLIMLIVFGALTIAGALIRYFFYFFHLQNDHLVIRTGWLKKKTLSIPLKSIQAVHLEQNVWQQVFGVARVSFDSVGSEKIEAKIDALPLAKAEELKQVLLSFTEEKPAASGAEENVEQYVYRLQPTDLLKLSLSANHLEAFIILVFLLLNLLDDLRDAFDVDSWGLLAQLGETMEANLTTAVTVMVIAAAIISIGFSSIRTFIKYYDFALQNEQHKWKLRFGLINRQQRIIPHSKIQVMEWQASWVRRKINFWMLDIHTIGKDVTNEKQKLKIPLTSIDAATSLAAVYQHTPVSVPHAGLMIEPAYWIRKTITTSLPSTIILIGIAAIWLQWQSLWIALLMIYFAFRNYRWFKNFRWHANDEGLQLYSGLWGRRYVMMKWSKVQQVRIAQSIYQRRRNLATVVFITAGQNVELPFVKIATAQALADNVLYLIESKEEPWM